MMPSQTTMTTMKQPTLRNLNRLLDARQLLSDYCQSDNLCVDGLRKRIDRFLQVQDVMDLSTSTGRLLLHHACMNERVTADIVRLLIKSFPGAAGGPKSSEKNFQPIPLHVACWNRNTTTEIVRLLIEAYPQSVLRQSVDGGLPLHYLCRGDCADSINVLRLLLGLYPDAAEHPTRSGLLPIHLAHMRSQSSRFCQLLNEANPVAEDESYADDEIIHRWTSSTEYLDNIFRFVKENCAGLK